MASHRAFSVGSFGRWLCVLGACGCFSACQGSPSKPDASANTSSQPEASATTVAAQAKNADRDGGYTSAFKPDVRAASIAAAQPPTTPLAARSADDEVDRYANATSPPANGDRTYRLSGNTESIAPRERPTLSSGTWGNPPNADAAAGNPLRDGSPATASGRPKEPLPAESSFGGDPLAAIPPPPVVPQRPDPKSELTIAAKPADPAGAPATAAQGPSVTIHPTPFAGLAAEPSPPEHPSDSVRPGPRTNKNSGIPFDPIKENGKFFEGWAKPKLALVITGMQEGYLEPCGCAGLERMKGGMSRRYSLCNMLRTDPAFRWPVVGMDVGGTAKGFGKQAEIKFQIAVNGMNAMHYSSAALGYSDLLLPTEEVLSQTMPANDKAKTMFVSGNVGLFAFDEKMLPRTQLINAGFKMIGATAILGETYQQKLAGNSNLKVIGAEKLLDEAVPLLKKRADFMVLLAHATQEEAKSLAKKYPDFNLVVCSEGGAEPPAQPEQITASGTRLVEVGEKGMCAIVIGLFSAAEQPAGDDRDIVNVRTPPIRWASMPGVYGRYQRVILDSRYKSAPEMVALMGAYQDQLKEMGLSGLGIRPLRHPLQATNGDYVGSAACQNCHEESYRVWKKTPHFKAFDVLRTAKPPRTFDPECISCHVVGWNPQKFFPYASGYLSEKETPKLVNVGCEDCHGPGEKHCWAEKHGTPADQQAARIAVRLTEQEAANPNCPKQNCFSCHDLDNSPEFKFDLYFPYVKHYERE